MGVRLIAAIVPLVGGCASQPDSPPAAPVAAPPVASATATQAKTVQEASIAGYRIVNQNGEPMYCREQLKTGSHLRKETICLTAKELEIAREASKRNLEQMQRRIPPPHGT
jgi:hypothetical protein